MSIFMDLAAKTGKSTQYNEDIPKLSTEQEAVIRAIGDGENILITGVAGTGKSFLVNEIMRKFDCDLTATTGIAALNIKGSTIHSWAALGIGKTPARDIAGKLLGQHFMKDKLRAIKLCKRLIIDEVSMMSAELLDTLDEVLKIVRNKPLPFGGIQMIFTGDFLQLPPVGKDEIAEFAFKAAAWQKANVKTYLLTKVFRQDDKDFISALHHIRIGKCGNLDAALLMTREGAIIPEGDVVPVNVYSVNAQADNKNMLELNSIAAPSMLFEAEDIECQRVNKPPMSDAQRKFFMDKLDKDCIAPKALILKEGAQVMLTKNLDVKAGLVNGSIGIVTTLEDGVPVVRFKNGMTIQVGQEEWELLEDGQAAVKRKQYPLRLAWAITIHKCQGMTLDSVYCDLSRVFEYGQTYVALSRAKTLDGLYLNGFHPNKVFANPEAVKFYEDLEND